MIKLQLFRFTSLLVLTGAVVMAQNAPTLRQGNTEIGLFAGAGYGLSIAGTIDNNTSESVPAFHLVAGGDVGYAVTKSIFIVGEASYFPSLGASTATLPPICLVAGTTGCQESATVVYSYKRKIVEFNGGIHYRLPVPESRFVPYLAGGVGAVHSLSSEITQNTICTGGCTGSSGNVGTLSGGTAFEVAAGAGARLYLSEHFGFRGEFRFYHPFGVSGLGSFYRVSAGLFFQLK